MTSDYEQRRAALFDEHVARVRATTNEYAEALLAVDREYAKRLRGIDRAYSARLREPQETLMQALRALDAEYLRDFLQPGTRSI